MSDSTQQSKTESGMRKRRLVELSREVIVKAGASNVLAVDAGAIGRMVALEDVEPTLFFAGSKKSDDGEDERYAPIPDPNNAPTSGVVAVVSIRGPLAQRAISDMCGYVDGYDKIAERFIKAISSSSVDSVVVVIDSPGGDAAGIEQAIAKMVSARDEQGKPVFVFVDELAASAGYWLASSLSSKGVFVPQAGRVGSVGCIGGFCDETAALEMEGVKVTLVRDPAGKAESHPAGPIVDLALERTQKSVSEIADRFMRAVGMARGMKPAAVRATNAEVFSGQAAVDVGFADEIASFEDVLARAAKAGRSARSKRNNTMSKTEAAEMSIGTTLVKSLAETIGEYVMDSLGVKTLAESVGKIEASKDATEKLSLALAENAKLAAVNAEQSALIEKLSKADIDAKAERMIEAARGDHRITPANRDKAFALYQKHGIDALASHLEALTPVPNSGAVEPAPVALTPKAVEKTEPNDEVNASILAGAEHKRLDAMTPRERHAYIDAHGIEAYRERAARERIPSK